MVKRSRLQRGRSSSPTTTPASSSFSSRSIPQRKFLFPTLSPWQIGTEVNVFSHLGKVLFSHMKEAMFADQPLVEEDEEGEEESDEEQVVNRESQKKDLGSENGSNENKDAGSDTAPLAKEPERPSDETVQIPMYKLEVDEEGKVKGEKEKVEEEKVVEEKVVTSMYGKVYKLKPGSAT